MPMAANSNARGTAARSSRKAVSMRFAGINIERDAHHLERRPVSSALDHAAMI